MPVAPVRAQQPEQSHLSAASPQAARRQQAAGSGRPAPPATTVAAQAVNADAANIVYERSRLNTDLDVRELRDG